MRHLLWPRTALLASALVLVTAVPARAGDPARDPLVLRDKIIQGVSDGLARKHTVHTAVPRPAVLPSRPAVIAGHLDAGPAHASATPAAALPSDSSADGIWAELLAGNQRFIGDHPLARDLTHERAELVAAQHPRAIVLACADSRVGPEIVFDQTLGQVFVVRTAGNIVDPIALGSIEYAVEHLHPHLLVVLGHSGCGAVKAAASSEDMPSQYLQAIVDRIRPTVQRLSNCFEGEELLRRTEIENARQSAVDILANSALLRDAVARSELRVQSAVYDLKTGQVTPVSLPAATAQATAPAR